MCRLWTSLIVSLTILAFAGSAQASLILEFDSPTYIIGSVGGIVDVDVFLRQTGGAPGPLNNEGLYSFGVLLDYLPASSAKVNSDVDIAVNSEFDDPNLLIIETTLSTSLEAASLGTVFPPSGDLDRIRLGTFKFTGISPGLTTITAKDVRADAGVDDFLNGLGDPLDSQITFGSTATINVESNVVPEPSSLYIFAATAGLFVLFSGLTRKRRSYLDRNDKQQMGF